MKSELFSELIEEFQDFFEDYLEILGRQRKKPAAKSKILFVSGIKMTVRPAYLFAERIDNILKILFAISICVSALTASYLGFTGLSELLDLLITSWWGRSIMFVIGSAYLLIAFWKLMHLGEKK